MDIRTLLAFLQRRWLILLIGTFASAFTAYTFASDIPPTYRATASLLLLNQAIAPDVTPATAVPPTVGPGTPTPFPPTPTPLPRLDDLLLTEQRVISTYAELVQRPVILQPVSDSIGGVYTAADLAGKMSVSSSLETQIIKVSIEDNDPALAAQIANGIANTFIQAILIEVGRPGTISLAQPALVPSSPTGPKVQVYTAVALVLGFIASAVFARGLDYLNDRIATPQDVSVALGIPTLGSIRKARREVPFRGEPDFTPLQDDFRNLRTFIQFQRKQDEGLRSMIIVSHGHGEGRTTVAAVLAAMLAKAGEDVILVDADLRHAQLHQIYNTPNFVGLADLLAGETDDLPGALVSTRVENLRLLPSGRSRYNPSDLLSSVNMTGIIESLESACDLVIFDSPALSTAPDAMILAVQVNGTLAVIEAGRTRGPELAESLSKLEDTGARVLGVVLNKAQRAPSNYETSTPGAASPDVAGAIPPGIRAIPMETNRDGAERARDYRSPRAVPRTKGTSNE